MVEKKNRFLRQRSEPTLEEIKVQTCSASKNDHLKLSFVKDIKVVV